VEGGLSVLFPPVVVIFPVFPVLLFGFAAVAVGFLMAFLAAVVGMAGTAKAEQDAGEQEEAESFPEGDRGKTKELRHQPVPEPHDHVAKEQTQEERSGDSQNAIQRILCPLGHLVHIFLYFAHFIFSFAGDMYPVFLR
jgi:hypothetical protein